MEKGQEELRKLWVRQLYKEYRNICYHYRLHLEPAVIHVADFTSKWGDWNPQTRTITLAKNLIVVKSWDIVLEVLKHEMAHQIVSEKYAELGVEQAHGPRFHEACSLLGMAEWAKKATLALDASELGDEARQLSEFEQNIMRKAKKLLALAESSNAHEAFLAMKKVQELYDKYHIEYLAQSDEPPYRSALITHHKRRVETHQSMLASLLVRHFHVQVIHCSIFHAESGTEVKAMELLGASHHVEMAEYVYWFVSNHLKILWQEHKKQQLRVGSLVLRNNFFEGVIAGFDEKLQAARKEKPVSERTVSTGSSLDAEASTQLLALLEQEERRLASYVAYRHPRLRTTYTYATARKDDAYRAGQKRGRELNLYKGVATRSGEGGKGRYLPGVAVARS